MAHYLKKNHTTGRPKHIVSIDIETKDDGTLQPEGERHRLYLGCLYYRRYDKPKGKPETFSLYEYRFHNHQQLYDILRKVFNGNKQRYYVYAHNANFDYAVMDFVLMIEKLGLEVNWYVNEKPPVIVKSRYSNNTILWLDSLNIFMLSLKQLATSMGLVAKGELEEATNDDELYEYCRNDCFILSEALHIWRTFIIDNDLGNYAYTLAGQSLNAYKHLFLPAKTVCQTTREEVLKKERQSYFGGRTECFRLGRYNQLMYMLDINSMYPSVMYDNDFPTSYFRTETDFNPFNKSYPNGIKPFLVKLTGTIVKPVLPCIINNKLCFPVGDISGYWCIPEVEAALPYLYDVEYEEVHMYRCQPLFREWVETFYNLRREYNDKGNQAYSYLIKIVMNSLYGKFGQLSPQWEDVDTTDLSDGTEIVVQGFEDEPIFHYRVRLGIVQQLVERTETQHSLPIVASLVTAHARTKLWKLFEAAGSDNVFYCDTDSLLVNQSGYENLQGFIEDGVLGSLSVQWTSPWVELNGLKDYSYDKGFRLKGIKPKASYKGDNTWQQLVFRSWDYHLSKKQSGFIDILHQNKRLTRKYTKGVLIGDGYLNPLLLHR